jgi:signal transduction histidine kinase/ADP-ribose pyrophosphatase YjhB (NUDIX family)
MMQPRFCPHCGSPIARPDRALATGRVLRIVCPECAARIDPAPASCVASILTRRAGESLEVLLIRRPPEARSGAGLYCLPGRTVNWNEDAREVAKQATWDQTGLEVEIRVPFDVHSNFHDPDRLTVGTWFQVELKNETQADPVAGAGAAQAAFFPLERLPELAFPTDRLVLERLAHDGVTDAPAAPSAHQEADLAAQLARRQQRYKDLLQAYTDELMRGAWINELHVRLAESQSVGEIAATAAEHIAGRREIDTTRIWFPGPPDRCDQCPWRDRCGRESCLHLHAQAGREARASSEVAELASGDTPMPESEPEVERIPFLRGVPAADVALQDAPHQAELPGAGAQPIRFEGFPLSIGDQHPGVLGLISRAPIDSNARRLFEVVARHVGALVTNARLVEDLTAANNVKRSFIARLSHELKTPITAILGFAELLRDMLASEGNDMGADGAATIEESGRKLLTIVNTILEIAKLESTAAAFRPKQVDLLELASERLEKIRKEAEEKNVELRLQLPKDFDESSVVWADPERVRQIFDQLLGNALKFTAPTQGKIEISARPEEHQVVCRVKDTGIGIAAEHHKQIFEVFTQVSEAIHLQYGGLGLGLALAKVLIEKQGGRIWVESQPGQGSSFLFTLPRSATRSASA